MTMIEFLQDPPTPRNGLTVDHPRNTGSATTANDNNNVATFWFELWG